MPIHPSIRVWLDTQTTFTTQCEWAPEAARRSFAFDISLEGASGLLDDVYRIEIPSPGGHLSLVHYPAPRQSATNGLVWFEDTGFLSGPSRMSPTLSRLVEASGWSVTVVETRGYPDHAYPSAHRDAEASVRWILENRAELDINGHVAVGGEGTGGLLAAFAASRLDATSGSRPVAQVLICPLLDALMSSASYESYHSGHGLARCGLRRCLDWYLPDDLDRTDARVSPFWASDLSGQLRSFVAVAEFDILRDEAEAYIRFLEDEGRDVTAKVYDGMIHGFLRLGALVSDSDTLVADITRFLNESDSD